MRYKSLRTVMLTGTPFVAGGVLLHQLLLWSSPALSRWILATRTTLASIGQWIQLTLAHISPAQLAVGVGVAWFIFVLALLLRSCTDRAEPLPREAQVHISLDKEYGGQEASTAVLADPIQAGNTSPRRSVIHLPPSDITAPPRLLPPHRPLLELPYSADDNVPYKPYSFFVVAECLGRPTSNCDEAGQRTVDLIVCQLAPSLAPDTAVAYERLSALFEMAALRASSWQRHDGIRTAADVTVLVAGILIIGNDVHVINFGRWNVYPSHPRG